MAPVSICMAITVLLVKALNPEGTADTTTVAIATLAYQEQDTDSAGQKLGGALLNAIIFMAVIAGMTFVLFLLFKWGCYKLIYGYMGFAMLNIFFFFTGALVLQLLRLIGLHMDLFSLAFLLFNFSVLGILSLFVMPVPLLLKQSYTVWVGICVAYIFTHIPEWTSWVLLVIMALYDLAAVLLPGGPLKILVELAIERQQELPALIYESRPTQRPYQRGMWRRQPPTGSSSSNAADGSSSAAAGSGSGLAHVAVAGGGGVLAGEIVSGSGGSPNVFARVALLGDQQHRSSWDEAAASPQPGSSSSDGGEGSEGELPDGIKLGLGDFIFYSMLVGRAAMYDMMTVFASYIAVISGLGITLMLLALYRKALPALPVSIALGVLFYFLTRLELQTGRFYYKDGAIYEGQYKVVGLPPPAPAEPAKKGAKKKEEEPPAQPVEPPKPVRHGVGTLKCGDYTYTGEWVDDEMHGQGSFSFASGACYEGAWQHNKYQGQGRYCFPDGKAYQGDWVSSVMHGQGSFTDTEGHCWAGQFYNGAGPGLTCQL
ncbi:hypothetical protein OEZ85_005365 [Tetradesmus obliquus]|uniref:Presenilin n=1 Tax=Tetradesmus obliquus TaxID=3088 RepID=A0ABY8UHP5_TETOB|nr:hypothetical protein OEZ85_005365 [Tetradesmus obliquus]